MVSSALVVIDHERIVEFRGGRGGGCGLTPHHAWWQASSCNLFHRNQEDLAGKDLTGILDLWISADEGWESDTPNWGDGRHRLVFDYLMPEHSVDQQTLTGCNRLVAGTQR